MDEYLDFHGLFLRLRESFGEALCMWKLDDILKYHISLIVAVLAGSGVSRHPAPAS